MKNINSLLFVITSCVVFSIFMLQSCDKMDDIQRKYAELQEQVYLGRVDSVKAYPGVGKVKLVWQINADPKIDQTVIYWNNRRDSLIKPFNRLASGIQKDSITITTLREGSTLFEFINVNSQGQRSLVSSVTITTWGSSFIQGLREREIAGFDYNYNQSIYNLVLTKANPGDSVIYAEIDYITTNNETKTVKVERNVDTIALQQFGDGGQFRLRTVFFPPQGIDTLYSEYVTYNAPVVVTDPGVKITLRANATSKYFNYEGDLAEWNSAGDLIVYTVAADGSATQKVRYNALAPRATYRDFFYYFDNKFIGVLTGNQLRLVEIVNGALRIIQTPAGANDLGTGFSMPKFAVGNGFFLSIDAAGNVRNWPALPNATFATPNNVLLLQGFTHDPYTIFNFYSLIGVDAGGYLASYPVSSSGSISAKRTIGMGWRRFTKLVGVGTKLYGIESDGDIFVFNNFNPNDKYWIVN